MRAAPFDREDVDDAVDRATAWRALVAYLGDAGDAKTLLRSLDAGGELSDARHSIAERWRVMFDRGAMVEADVATPSVELLITAPPPESSGVAGARVSRTLVSTASVPDRQRRAVIAKHVGGLAETEVADMLEVSIVEAVELTGQGEAIIAIDSQSTTRDHLQTPEVIAAGLFAPLNQLPLPASLATGDGGDGDVSKLSTVLAVVAVGCVAAVGLLLVIGTPDVDEADSPDLDQAAAGRELQQSLRGPDRSHEISVSPLGEIVRRDPETGAEVWRSAPLGEIEVASVDLNTVTVRKGDVLLRVSLTDGTFLPP